VPSRRCYALVRMAARTEFRSIPQNPGYMGPSPCSGPVPVPHLPVQLPEWSGGDKWKLGHLPAGSAAGGRRTGNIELDGAAAPCPMGWADRAVGSRHSPVQLQPGPLAIASWMAGLGTGGVWFFGASSRCLKAKPGELLAAWAVDQAEATPPGKAFEASRARPTGCRFIAGPKLFLIRERFDGFCALP